MNDYFDQFERSVGAAVAQGSHDPWYARLTRIRHGRTLAVVFGAMVIGAPAGAVSSCFGACVPVHRAAPSASAGDPGALAQSAHSPLFRVVDTSSLGFSRATTPRTEGR